MSPNYHHHHYTPPRSSAQQYDSPMLTPSPLRQTTVDASSLYDPSQSSFKSAAQAQPFNPCFANMPQHITVDDEEGSIFLSPAPSDSFTSFFSSSSSQPLRTPVKQVHRIRSRSILSPKPMNTIFGHILPSADSKGSARVGKRKSTPHATPLRQHNLTPLELANATNSSMSPSLDRLAPLAAPKFIARTPQTKAETDAYLTRQTATMTKLKISDQHNIVSDDEFEGVLNDSGCEMDVSDPGNGLFLNKRRLSTKGTQPPKSLVFRPSASKEKEEVAEAISPGGHIIKRRARSRPVSAELLESSFKSPKSPIKSVKRNSNNRPRNAVAFPGTAHRGHASPASSSDAGSPRVRRRISGNITLIRPQTNQSPDVYPSRAPLSRIESVSSATLFFGPSIPPKLASARSRTNTNLSAATPAPFLRCQNTRGNLTNRHSYAGPESSANALHVWNTVQTRNVSPSPRSSPCHARDSSHHRDTDEDEDMFFGPEDSSFVLNVTSGTPSPQSKVAPSMKFKHRNYLLVSDEDEMLSTGSSAGGDFLQAMPKASTSVSSICSDDGLVTPGAAPEGYSGWPTAVYNGADDAGDNQYPYGLTSEEGVDVDTFIIRTLAAASKGPQLLPKKIPGTPVKKVRMSYFGNERPWQSAVASKVGLRDDCDFNKKVPRKSLPTVFPPVGARATRLTCEQSDSEDEQESPITRRDKYANLGLGQPPLRVGKNIVSGIPRSRWLMRRSSSGAFSSGSDSASLANTPTRSKGIDWNLPKPRIPVRLSPSSDAIKVSSSRSHSGSSSSSIATLNSPTNGKRSTVPSVARQLVPRPTLVARRLSDSFAEEQPGRFERDFVEIEEVGSGEFGKVIKVQCQGSEDVELYAVKKSKRFEGTKHRLRLREEVDVLKHLSQAALSTGSADGRHSNVLAYIDSWEEDEALYIRTELCEWGNLARFLWEYGRVFPRLDEARVWKVIVDLSNGLRFIHDSGVIHLDLKPSNVFVTKEGRFKIGDFGMASFWPRAVTIGNEDYSFEREGDKLYLAPEVLQGIYGKAADVFSLGMMVLETASNIVVPDQGEAWHRLRREDLSQVDLDESPELVGIIKAMMRTEPSERMSAEDVCLHGVVARTREKMELLYSNAKRNGTSVFVASPLASVPSGFLEQVLCSSSHKPI